MAQTREDGAPPGTSYACIRCGYDIRWNDAFTKKETPKGVYVKKVGVTHKTEQDCMKAINWHIDRRFYLDTPHHREEASQS